jgi:hypothetical protein
MAIDANGYLGGTGGQKIRAAVNSVAGTGGTIDCTNLAGPVLLDVDIAGELEPHNNRPYAFLWGAQEVRVAVSQGLRSHHHHVLHGTLFISKDANGDRVTGTTMFRHLDTAVAFSGPRSGVGTTKGGGVLTKADPSQPGWAYLETDSPLAIFGRINQLGVDRTTLSQAIGSGGTTVTVANTTGFPDAGHLRIEDELLRYSGRTPSQFTGCTRGAEGTTAASHPASTPVERPTYEAFFCESVTGKDLTLGNGETMDLAAGNLSFSIGALDVSFDGVGVFDGNMDPAKDDRDNPFGIQIVGGRHLFIGPGLLFRNFDHGGVDLELAQDFRCHGRYVRCGRPTLGLGSGVWLFGRCKRGFVEAQVEEVSNGVTIDDRSTNPLPGDGLCEDVTVVVRNARRARRAISLSGSRRCHLTLDQARDLPATGIGILLETGQWIENVAGHDNVAVVGPVQGSPGCLGAYLDATYAGVRTAVHLLDPATPWKVPDGSGASGSGVVIQRPARQIGVRYGPAVDADLAEGDFFVVSVANGDDFTVNNPANPFENAVITYCIYNASGGVMGAVGWGSEFRPAGPFSKPAHSRRRTITFRRQAGLWREIARTAADEEN